MVAHPSGDGRSWKRAHPTITAGRIHHSGHGASVAGTNSMSQTGGYRMSPGMTTYGPCNCRSRYQVPPLSQVLVASA